LFAIDPKGRLEVFSAENPLDPGPGWAVMALIDPASEKTGGTATSDPAQAGEPEVA
jgi:hypothetical protein